MKTLFLLLVLFLTGVAANASELFLRVNTGGSFYAQIMDQTQYNNSNIFKFFNLPVGIVNLRVLNQQSNMPIYNGQVQLNANERVVAEIDNMGNFTVVQKTRIQEINWYTSIENGNGNYGNYGNGGYGNYGNGNYGGNYPNHGNYGGHHPNHDNHGGNYNYGAMNFQQFMPIFKKESFDSGKLELAKNYVATNRLNAQQIAEITRNFSFDSNRLAFAKYAYPYCIDKNNYFQLKPAFQFSSSYDDLVDSIGF